MNSYLVRLSREKVAWNAVGCGAIGSYRQIKLYASNDMEARALAEANQESGEWVEAIVLYEEGCFEAVMRPNKPSKKQYAKVFLVTYVLILLTITAAAYVASSISITTGH